MEFMHSLCPGELVSKSTIGELALTLTHFARD